MFYFLRWEQCETSAESQSLTLDHMMHQCSLDFNTTSTDFHATSLLKFYHSANTVPLWNMMCHNIYDFLLFLLLIVRAKHLTVNTNIILGSGHSTHPSPPPDRVSSLAHVAVLIPNFNTLSNIYSFLKPLFLLWGYPSCPHDCDVHLKTHHEILSYMSLIAHNIYGQFPLYIQHYHVQLEQSSYVFSLSPCEGLLSSRLYQCFEVKEGNVILYTFPTCCAL